MSIMPLLDCFRVSVHTDWSLSSEYFFFYIFTVNFNVYSEVCRYPKKNHFYPILGNLSRFGKHCYKRFVVTTFMKKIFRVATSSNKELIAAAKFESK
jgi:hypothetical protein